MARILVLGDDPAETNVLALIMEFAGQRCTTIDSLQGAVSLLQTKSFDLVAAGLRLNGSRLEDVVKSLQSVSSEVLVMVITENSKSAQKAERLHAVPLSREELLSWLTMLGKATAAARKASEQIEAHLGNVA